MNDIRDEILGALERAYPRPKEPDVDAAYSRVDVRLPGRRHDRRRRARQVVMVVVLAMTFAAGLATGELARGHDADSSLREAETLEAQDPPFPVRPPVLTTRADR